MMSKITFPLLNDNPSHTVSRDLAELVTNLLREHEVTLAGLHGGGQQAVSHAIMAGGEYIDAVPVAEAEIAEAEGALGVALALNQRAYDCLSYTFNQIRSIAPDLTPEQARILRAAYALGSRRLSLRRVSDLRVLLEQSDNAHATHGALLRAWGVPQTRLDEPGLILADYPDASAAVQKEQGEAEAANAVRDAAEQRFYERANSLLRRVLAMQDDHPELAKTFASTINKYAAQLNPPNPSADESAEPVPTA